MDLQDFQDRIKGFFPEKIGVTFVEVSPDRIRATLRVHDELCTVPGILHGGVIMSLADTLGAVGTVLNLPDGASGTTTIESKTNFFSPLKAGTQAIAEATPLHRGRRTQVWQTRVTTEEGKLAAMVTQTQMVLYPRVDNE